MLSQCNNLTATSLCFPSVFLMCFFSSEVLLTSRERCTFAALKLKREEILDSVSNVEANFKYNTQYSTIHL